MLLTFSLGGAVVWGAVVFFPKIISHKLFTGFLCPCKMSFSSFVILTVSLSKIALHPASHNCAIEISDAEVNCGKIRASLADSGKPGIGKNASCVFWMRWLFGRRTEIGVCATLLFLSLNLTVR